MICYVGGVSRVRGVEQLIAAMKRVDAHLIIAGEVSEEYKEYLKKLDDDDKVRFCGFLQREEVVKLYKRSLIGCFIMHFIPNAWHSLPIKIFEYMAAGLPVVVTRTPLMEKIVADNGCGIMIDDPFDINEIAATLNKLIHNSKLCDEMGRNGRKIVYSKYNWGIVEKKLLNFYKRIAEQEVK